MEINVLKGKAAKAAKKRAYSRGLYVSGQRLKQATSDTEQKTTTQKSKKLSNK